MAKRKQTKSPGPYVRRLAEDKYVQEQLGNAATRLREGYGRVSKLRGKAAEDKKLFGNLREAATSIRNATLALQRHRVEPKRRGRKVVLIVLAGGGAAVILSERGREKLQGAFSSSEAAPSDVAEAGTAPAGTSSPQPSEPAAPATS
jgi:hypothetical protein